MIQFLTAVFSALGSLFKYLFKNFSSQTSQDRLRREQADLEVNTLKEELNALHELSLEHDKQVIRAIDPMISDEEASKMLSEDPSDDTTLH